MSHPFSILCVGGLTQDIHINDHYTLETITSTQTKINIDSMHTSYGGGSFNAAANFAKQNQQVSVLGSIGNDAIGQALLQACKHAKIQTNSLQICTEVETGTSIIFHEKNNEHRLISYRGANEQLKLISTESDYDIVYISSLPHRAYKKLPNFLAQQKGFITFCPGKKQLEADVSLLFASISFVDILCMNEYEMQVFNNLNNIETETLFIKTIQNYMNGIVVITKGSQGATIYQGNKSFHQPCISVPYITNTLGAGDAFASTFTLVYKQTKNINIAALQASKQSSNIVTSLDTTTTLEVL